MNVSYLRMRLLAASNIHNIHIEDEWHYRLNGHEFEQAPADGEGQGSLVCCSPWDFRVRHDWATEKQYILYEHMSVNLMNENTIFYISCMKTCAYFMYKNRVFFIIWKYAWIYIYKKTYIFYGWKIEFSIFHIWNGCIFYEWKYNFL